ncbi:MAG: DUF1223 domain-containing protein [Methylocapsa sp.]|nr:DUF1223 domain-containing protein [Methylocapsa sp.]
MELFTSQGCPYSPRADEWLAAVAHNPGVVAVSFPVDYWDFIGWKDTLASPAFTARQKAYAAANRSWRAYTPQVIVDGIAAAAGGHEDEIEQAISKAKGRSGAMSVPMRLVKSSGHYSIEIGDGDNGPASVILLTVARSATVKIRRGENAGRSVTYTNVARTMNKLGEWTGKSETFNLPDVPQDGRGFIVLMQEGTPEHPGAILAAAKSDGL